jgi:hypothetical protein
VTNKSICSCASITAKAEDDPVVPDVEEEPGVDEPEETEEKPSEEEEVTVDTLQEFLDEHGVTREELVANLESRKNTRKEQVAVIAANSTLTEDQLSVVSDAVLEIMAASYSTESQTTGGPMYAVRGLPEAQPTKLEEKRLSRRKPLLDKTA